MEISQIQLARLLIYSFFFGLITGLFYDLNRALRVMLGVRYSKSVYRKMYAWRLPIVKKELRTGKAGIVLQNVIINIGDFFSIIFAVCGLITLNYAYNDGRFRFFTVGGIAAGILMYRLTMSKLMMLVVEPLIYLIRYLVTSIIVVLVSILKTIGVFFGKKTKKIARLYSFTLEKRKEKLYNINGDVRLPDDKKQLIKNHGKKVKTRGEHSG